MKGNWATGGKAKAHTSTAYAKGGSVRSESTEQAQQNDMDLYQEKKRAKDVFSPSRQSDAADARSFDYRYQSKRETEASSERTGHPGPTASELKDAWKAGADEVSPTMQAAKKRGK